MGPDELICFIGSAITISSKVSFSVSAGLKKPTLEIYKSHLLPVLLFINISATRFVGLYGVEGFDKHIFPKKDVK